jgi:hypothetical protein
MRALKEYEDDSSWVRLQMVIFLKSKQPWIELAEETQKFQEGPT